jgi:hypothetical protein
VGELGRIDLAVRLKRPFDSRQDRGEHRVASNSSRSTIVDRIRQLQVDPTLAAGVGGIVGDRLRVPQAKCADREQVQRLVGFVVPAYVELFGGPNMQVVEGVERCARGDLPDVGDFAEASNRDFGGFGGEDFYLIAPLGLDAVGTLVEPGGEEGEAGCGEAEAAGAVGFFDAALAEQDRLVAGEESVADDGPFFEGDIQHRRIVTACPAVADCRQ